MPGVATPCTKRQKISCSSVRDVPASAVPTVSIQTEPTMVRRRPMRSAKRPMKGANIATPILGRGGKIVSVAPASRAQVPAGAERVSLEGKTVIPGIVNAHGHVGNTEGLEQGHYSAANVVRDLKTYAAYGITTVFSLGDDQAAGIVERDRQNTPALDRARLFVAGPVLNPKTV